MEENYKKCLTCGKDLLQTKGKRDKVFCGSTCRSNYWQKSERLQKKGVSDEQIILAITKTWKIIAENNKHENKAKIEAEKSGKPDSSKKEVKQPLMPQDCENETVVIDFSDDAFLNVEKHTKFPKSKRPETYIEASAWDKQKAAYDLIIRQQWQNRKK